MLIITNKFFRTFTFTVLIHIFIFMGNRICKSCGKSIEIEEFPIARTINDKIYYRHICSECYGNSKKMRKNKIRNQILEYKKTLKCIKCNNNDYRVLEFHHNGNKDFNISDAKSKGYSFEKIKKEIQKCSVLCANCHRIEHYEG